MNKASAIVISVICAILLFCSWHTALTTKSASQKQLDLLQQAARLIEDEIYILAAPLLEEAVSYDSLYSGKAEEELKKVYLALLDTTGYARKYTTLLDAQMSRSDAPPGIYIEAADYYFGTNNIKTALTVLRNGIDKTADAELIRIYESNRYIYELSRPAYDEIKTLYGQTAQVCKDGKWGIANTDGTILIPCLYDKTGIFYLNSVVVMKDGLIYAVDKNNNRIAVAPDNAFDFRNPGDNRTSFLLEDGWFRTDSSFKPGITVFEDIGMYSGGYAAAKTGGKWGVITTGSEWLLEPVYDGIIQDEQGRCYGQGALFVRNGDKVFLYSGSRFTEETYEDAHPFGADGYAAVSQNGKWGFTDTSGNVMIDFIFDDALSFNGNLAAVKTGDCWGYINPSGSVVIEQKFLDAKSFENGSAAVLTQKGWQFITLIEYKNGGRLV